MAKQRKWLFNSAWGTISRLIDMGVPSFLIANTLNVSVAQRLVRTLCPHCKKNTQNQIETIKSRVTQLLVNQETSVEEAYPVLLSS